MGMLVLDIENKKGFHIDDDIEIVILGINEKRARIGIQAPKEKKILRNELYLQLKKDNEKADMK